MKAAISLAVLLIVGTSSRHGRAQDAASADVAFEEGRELLKDGRYAEACAKFEQSFKLDPATGTLLNLGDCFEKLGKTASAWATFNRAAARAASEQRAKHEAEARRRLALLEPNLTRLRIGFPRPPEAAKVFRDDVDITELIGIAVPVDPGRIVIRARAPGFIAREVVAEAAAAGETIDVEIPALERRPLPVPEPEAVIETGRSITADIAAPETDLRGRGRRRVALGLGIAGGLSLASAGATSLLARSAWRSSQASGCVEGRCREQGGFDDARRAHRLGLASEILAGVGIAAVSAATILWLTTASERSPKLGLIPLESGGGVSAFGHF